MGLHFLIIRQFYFNMTKVTFLSLIAVLIFSACQTKNLTKPSEPEIINSDSLCTTIVHGKESAPAPDLTADLAELEDLYEKFELYVREKNGPGLRSIMLHNLFPLYITGKEPGGIVHFVLNGLQFEQYNLGNPNLHELRISNTEFFIYNGFAVSWADYDEYENSNPIGKGVDLFYYIKTAEGWKLATTNNTYILTGDNTDYEATQPMTTIPISKVQEMVNAFNEEDKDTFLSAFATKAPFIVLSGALGEDYSNDIHTASAFIDCALNDANDFKLSISNETIEIQDQFLAKVEADYSLSVESGVIESGKMVLTLIGTPQGGWKISAAGLDY